MLSVKTKTIQRGKFSQHQAPMLLNHWASSFILSHCFKGRVHPKMIIVTQKQNHIKKSLCEGAGRENCGGSMWNKLVLLLWMYDMNRDLCSWTT